MNLTAHISWYTEPPRPLHHKASRYFVIPSASLFDAFVSIPQRDIGILELVTQLSMAHKSSFQSLKGISAFWNLPSASSPGTQYMFQSLKGISAFWNQIIKRRDYILLCLSKGYRHFGTRLPPFFLNENQFQSLKGISAFWNLISDKDKKFVSIPQTESLEYVLQFYAVLFLNEI